VNGGLHGLGGLRRHAHLGATLAASTLRSPELPFKLTVALTWRCHHRCACCGIWRRDKGEELPAEAWARVFASLPGLAWLDLTGGEPTARTDFARVVASLNSGGLDEAGRGPGRSRPTRLAIAHFPTAGMVPQQAEAAARALRWPGGPRVLVTVSFDGDRELHDRLRGVVGAFDRAVETWQRLRAVPGVQVVAGLTLQPGNVGQWRRIADALCAALPGFELADLHANVLHRSPHYFGNLEAATPDGAALVADLRGIAAAKGARRDPVQLIERAYLALLPGYLQTGRSPLPCRSAELSAFVDPAGTVFACTIDPRPIGRLADFNFDFAALWRSQSRLDLSREVAADRCVGCWTPCEAYQTLLTQPRRTLLAWTGRALRA